MAEKDPQKMGAKTSIVFMFTLDTNVLIYYAGGDSAVSEFLLHHLREKTIIFLPTVVIIEFFAYPPITSKDQTLFESLLPQLEVKPLDEIAAFRAARIRNEHKLKLGDSIVAETALHTRSALVTRNIRDFKKIPELKIMKV